MYFCKEILQWFHIFITFFFFISLLLTLVQYLLRSTIFLSTQRNSTSLKTTVGEYTIWVQTLISLTEVWRMDRLGLSSHYVQKDPTRLLAEKLSEEKKESFRCIGLFGVLNARTEGKDDYVLSPTDVCHYGLATMISNLSSETKRTVIKKMNKMNTNNIFESIWHSYIDARSFSDNAREYLY